MRLCDGRIEPQGGAQFGLGCGQFAKLFVQARQRGMSFCEIRLLIERRAIVARSLVRVALVQQGVSEREVGAGVTRVEAQHVRPAPFRLGIVAAALLQGGQLFPEHDVVGLGRDRAAQTS